MRLASRTALLGVLLTHTGALRVAPGSQCGVQCGNVLDSTSKNDIVCKEADYKVASAGQVFQECISCESTSDYVSKSASGQQQTDLGSMLYNMRYAMAYCIYGDLGNDDIGSNPCLTTTACGPFRQAIEIDQLSTNASTYSYCSLWDYDHSEKCSECLLRLPDGHIQNNFFQVLEGACRVSPKPGQTLGLDGDIFSLTNPVNVSSPTPTASIKSHEPAGPLSLGAIVGVVIGGVVTFLALMGCCVVWNGKRRRKAYLRKREEMKQTWPSPAAGSGMFQTLSASQQQPLRNWGDTPVSQAPLRGNGWGDTPVSQRGPRGWDESPITPVTEHTYPPEGGRYFSPYGSQFTSPVSAGADGRPQGPTLAGWPAEKAAQQQNGIGVAISPDEEHGHNAFWGDKKGKDREQQQQHHQPPHHNHQGYGSEDTYEMQEGVGSAGGYAHHEPQQHQQYHQNTAPVLEHPGYGRRGRE
ncbi:hypothetical protein PG994_002907 [Apiospora phragmitis]|uniref:Lpxtg-domain-containing protein n=1 Tax=Apiospora phragmitis TaxID=2905665 RepID=A0ABR1W9E8_9PEZI